MRSRRVADRGAPAHGGSAPRGASARGGPHRGGAGRVIAGVARGRRLAAPGEGTRPLGDRVKESLFAILEPQLPDEPFLDLFAGSGAAGIEALSRGAGRATFVERDRPAVRTIERNLAATGLAGARATILPREAVAWLASGEAAVAGPFAAVLVDPPYDRPELLERSLDAIAGAGRGGILAADGVVVAKHFRGSRPPGRIRLLRSVREERFGETTLTFYRWAGPDDAGAGSGGAAEEEP